MVVIRERDRVRLKTKDGYDWTKRFPWIVKVARKMRQSHFVIDDEAVVLGVDGISDFDALHSRQQDYEVQLYAFDMLASDGDDHRKLPLSMRKANLARLLARRPEGIFVADYEQGEIVRGRLQDGPGGHGFQASRARLQCGGVARTGSRSRTRSIRLTSRCRISSDKVPGTRHRTARRKHQRPPQHHEAIDAQAVHGRHLVQPR
ncbi:hypothetical protein [Bradyrhizobium sp. ERR14]|uniref:ATP-dependent DNA ligase n=1 Tax=Bradyrhizobium sp. ERR14 TaxID=2663837 RepID=UPI0017BD443B|nr:hypothetical protein [Bradyrhizobium sp. ERR14]MBB4392388.1 hypothetical protein [Bradyrhizobium sp. ERR14]